MMSERSSLGVNPATTTSMATLTLEEPGAEHQASPRAPGPLRCGPCALWPRQQTWLCAVPLLMGFVGLGLSLMLLKWIVVGSVQDYVPTDLVDAKGIGQDPFFLSKPSTLPKGADTTTTTAAPAATNAGGASGSSTPNAATASTGPPMVTGSPSRAANGTASVQRTRTGPPANHTRGRGSGTGGDEPRYPNRAPGGGGKPGSGGAAPTATTTTTTTTASPRGSPKESTTTTSTTRAPTTTSTVAVPVKPTSRWNSGPGRSSKGSSTTRPHHRFRTPPTNPTPRSDHFKRCQDKDLAFCLNEGECFIIETVAGVHRHCRCKEGYHGLRCDQFVPKTDAILSDPTDELGIEFMESNETYQRQVLSIFSIAMGISFLGVACMALYCRNKRQREKHRSHLAESRHLRDCSVNASGLMSKSNPRPRSSLQPGLQQHCCKANRSSPPHGGSVEPCCSAVCPANQLGVSPKGKRLRSGSLSVSPPNKQRSSNHRSPSHWTPPIGRSRHHLIGGARDSGHAYRHLQEVGAPEIESLKRCKSHKEGDKEPRQPSLNMQTGDLSAQPREGWRGLAEVPCTRLDKGSTSPSPSSSSSSTTTSPSLLTSTSQSMRAISVPIIPFVQGHSGGDARGPAGETAVCLETDPRSVDYPANVLGPVPETLLGSATLTSVSHGHHYHHHHNHHHHHHHALVLGSSEEAAVGSGDVAKHKSLVTFTTALGSSMGTAHVSTVVSAAVAPPVQGPGAPSKQQHQSPASLQPTALPRRPHGPARLPAPPPHMGGKRVDQQGNGHRDPSTATAHRAPLASAKHRDGSTTATTARTS